MYTILYNITYYTGYYSGYYALKYTNTISNYILKKSFDILYNYYNKSIKNNENDNDTKEEIKCLKKRIEELEKNIKKYKKI